ncbi:MAG: hypothetical protein IKJ01_02765 [Lachnospiraceae bacterium]|nr:hypothetical protein [Lachnospiraceae bacterium]
MKTTIFGIIAVLIAIYTMALSLGIYNTQIRKNQLENSVSQIVKETLELAYPNGDESIVKEELINHIKSRLNNIDTTKVEVLAFDLEKGIISVKVTETYNQLSGREKIISLEKTAIMEKEVEQDTMQTVVFSINGEIYKQYQVITGEYCQIPKCKRDGFIGWKNANLQNSHIVNTEKIGPIYENVIYEGVLTQ